jgi:hypothetical protein
MKFTDLVAHPTQLYTSFAGKRRTFRLQSSFSMYSHIKNTLHAICSPVLYITDLGPSYSENVENVKAALETMSMWQYR